MIRVQTVGEYSGSPPVSKGTKGEISARGGIVFVESPPEERSQVTSTSERSQAAVVRIIGSSITTNDDPLDLIGKTVSGQDRNNCPASYEIKGFIGKGGMGAVYLASMTTERSQKPKDVAVKFLTLDGTSRDEANQINARFNRSLKIMLKFAHPHILSVKGYGDDKSTGAKFIATPFMKGGDLDQKLKAGDIKLGVALLILADMAEALGIIYPNVHGDFKPSNVFLSNELINTTWPDRPLGKLGDFDLAKRQRLFDTTLASTAITDPGSISGTPAYMSPEQAAPQKKPGSQGEFIEPDFRSDLFSLGTTLYRTLTGVMPFTGSNRYQLLRSIDDCKIEPMSEVNPDAYIPDQLKTLVEDYLMQKEPKVRTNVFRTGKDVANYVRQTVANIYPEMLNMDIPIIS